MRNGITNFFGNVGYLDTIANDLGVAGGANQDDLDAAINAAVAAYAGQGTLAYNAGTGVITYTATTDGDQMTTLNFSLLATNDTTQEADEDFSLAITTPTSTTGTSVSLGASNAVTTTITDDDVATVSIAATTDGDETGTVDGVFTVSMTNPADVDTVIDYTVTGTATSANDFTTLSGQVTILAGQTSATINIPTIDDNLAEGPPVRKFSGRAVLVFKPPGDACGSSSTPLCSPQLPCPSRQHSLN